MRTLEAEQLQSQGDRFQCFAVQYLLLLFVVYIFHIQFKHPILSFAFQNVIVSHSTPKCVEKQTGFAKL